MPPSWATLRHMEGVVLLEGTRVRSSIPSQVETLNLKVTEGRVLRSDRMVKLLNLCAQIATERTSLALKVSLIIAA